MSGFSRIRVAVVSLLTLVSVLLGGLALHDGFALIDKNFAGFTFSPRGEVTSLMHAHWTGYQAGLHTKDKILSYDQVPFDTQVSFNNYINSKTGQSIAYKIERDGKILDFKVPTMVFTVDDFLATFFADFMIGSIWILLGVVLFLLNTNLYGNFLLCLSSFGIGFMHLLATDYYLAQTYSGVLLWSFVFFALTSSQTNFDLLRRDSVLFFSPKIFNRLIFTATLVMAVLWQLWFKNRATHQLFSFFCLISYAISFLVAHSNCLYVYFTTDSLLTRKIIRVFNTIFISVILPYSYYLLRDVFNILIPREFVFLQMVYPLLLAATIVRFRAIDFNIHLGRPTLFAMIGFLLVGGLGVLFTVIPLVFRVYALPTTVGHITLFMTVAATVVLTVYSAHTRLFDKLFFHSSYRFPSVINAVNEAVLTKMSVDEVMNSIKDILERDFKISRAFAYLEASKEDDFVLWKGNGPFAPSLPSKIERDLVDRVGDDFFLSAEMNSKKEIVSILVANQLSLVLPITHRSNLTGLIFLGNKTDKTPFSPEDITNLKTFFGILATAISHARQHETILTLQEKLKDENKLLKVEVTKLSDEIVGERGDLKEIFRNIEKISHTDMTVLLQGESGVGKEVIARALHDRSLRADKKFVAINCAALTESLLESELFGHERGAFTDAQVKKIGLFESAENGTLFLDEIGEITPLMQSKLLRVLQEKEIKRVGGTNTISVNVRIIAATNKNLESEVKAGKFRKDLFYRLNVFPILIPPLRQRLRDLEELIPYFIRVFSEKFNRDVRLPDQATWNMLMEYSWPGNVRELKNVIERSVAVCPNGERLNLRDLDESLFEAINKKLEALHSDKGYHEQMGEFQKNLIKKALSVAEGNKAQAARNLGIHVTHLYKILKQTDLQ